MTTKAQERVQTTTLLVLAQVAKNRRRNELRKAGKQRDSLLRALIPLYVARATNLEVTSGVTQRFWRAYGVDVHATVMAKALREHIGYARMTREGRQITPNGVKYVEAALRDMNGAVIPWTVLTSPMLREPARMAAGVEHFSLSEQEEFLAMWPKFAVAWNETMTDAERVDIWQHSYVPNNALAFMTEMRELGHADPVESGVLA